MLPVHQIPAVESIGPQPVGTWGHVQVGLDVEASADDRSWLAHFYVRPNLNFFPDPGSFAPIGPTGIRLTAAVQFNNTGSSEKVWLYPHPDGSLALAVTSGQVSSGEDPLKSAFDRISPILDHLSVVHDQPLHVCQMLWFGLPSGTMNYQLARPAQPVSPSLEGDFGFHPMTADARSLYREAASALNPFHQFLGFWRVQENIGKLRGKWCSATGRASVAPIEERMPRDVFAWSRLGGRRFGSVLQDLERPFRHALAHGYLSEGEAPRTGARSADFFEVAGNVPVIRYIARVSLINFEETLRVGGRDRSSPPPVGREPL